MTFTVYIWSRECPRVRRSLRPNWAFPRVIYCLLIAFIVLTPWNGQAFHAKCLGAIKLSEHLHHPWMIHYILKNHWFCATVILHIRRGYQHTWLFLLNKYCWKFNAVFVQVTEETFVVSCIKVNQLVLSMYMYKCNANPCQWEQKLNQSNHHAGS